MDKWEDLKSWVSKGIKSLEQLSNESTSFQESQRLQIRKKEFEQFLQKMDEIENYCQHKYQCPRCNTIAVGQEWDETSKKLWKQDIISIDVGYNNGEYLAWICLCCGSELNDLQIKKIM